MMVMVCDGGFLFDIVDIIIIILFIIIIIVVIIIDRLKMFFEDLWNIVWFMVVMVVFVLMIGFIFYMCI